jgi:hypothetical protein
MFLSSITFEMLLSNVNSETFYWLLIEVSVTFISPSYLCFSSLERYFETSAKSGENIPEVFQELSGQILEDIELNRIDIERQEVHGRSY